MTAFLFFWQNSLILLYTIILFDDPYRSRRQSLFLAAVKTDEKPAYLIDACTVHLLGNVVMRDLYPLPYNV